jgi:hypothetical protein
MVATKHEPAQRWHLQEMAKRPASAKAHCSCRGFEQADAVQEIHAVPQGPRPAIRGSGLNIGTVVETRSEVLKEARKAAEQYDVKTWVRMMTDKAKGK